MTVYRAADAIAHWRHLTVLLLHTDYGGIDTVADTAQLAAMRHLAWGFPSRVLDYSNGMCAIQQQIVEIDEEFTEGVTAGAVKSVKKGEMEAHTGPLGLYAFQHYDTAAVILPIDSYAPGAYGMTTAPHTELGSTHTGFSSCYITHEAGIGFTFLANLLLHEWTHAMTSHLDGHQGFAMPGIDSSGAYCWDDDVAHTSEEEQNASGTDERDFLRSVLTGRCKEIATGTVMGCTAQAWASGTPRHP